MGFIHRHSSILRLDLCSYSVCAVGTYRVAAAITQFAGDSTKYFGTYHAEFPKSNRDPA